MHQAIPVDPIFNRRFISCLVALVWGGIGFLLLVPVFVERDVFYPFSTSKGTLFLAGVQFTFAAWTLLVLFSGDYRPKVDLVKISLFAFLICLVVSAISTQDFSRNFWSTYERMSGLVMQAHLFGLFLILASFLRNEEDWSRLFFTSALIASYISIVGVIDNLGPASVVPVLEKLHLAPSGLSVISHSGSTLGNTSFMGSYLQINAFFSIFLFFTAKGRSRIAAGLILAVITSGILLNPGGRAMKGSFLLGVCCIVVVVCLFRSRSHRFRMIASVVLYASLPLAILGGILLAFKSDILLASAMDVRGVPERIVVWEAATSGFFERPIFGWGLENFDLMFYRNFDPAILIGPGRTIGPPWFDRAHNIVFDLLVPVGIVGFAAYFFAMLVSVLSLGGASRRNGNPGVIGFVVFTVLFLAHFLQNLTVFDTISSQMLLYAVFAYASHHSPGIQFRTLHFASKNPSEKSRAPVIAWLCCVPILFFAYRDCVHTPRAVAKAVGALEGKINDDDVLNDYIFASSSASVGRHQVRVRLAELAAIRLSPSVDADQSASRLREVDYVLGELEKSTRESPANFQIPFTAGRLCSATAVWSFEKLNGDEGSDGTALRYVDASIAAYRSAIQVCPNHALAFFELSRALVYKGYISGDSAYFNDALEVVESAIALAPGLFASHDLAVDIVANLLGDRQLALEKVDRAVAIKPSWKRVLIKRVRELDP